MAFSTKNWQDRMVEFPGRRRLTDTGEQNVVDVTREEGTITQAGDAFSATNMNNLESRIQAAFNSVFPVGAIFFSVNNVNPAEYFVGSTWTRFGAGRVIVGVNTADADFNTVEKTGGVKTHRHNWQIGMHWWYGATAGEGAANGTGAYKYSNAQYDGWARELPSKSLTINNGYAETSTPRSSVGKYSQGDTSSTSNLSPYITCYMWKRVT